ncbi:hypothetical protein QO190_13015 [Cloacibacterium sp. Arc13]|uniref:hypothetical protein n=1 Tax=unclassified Cloacibacterium TaxID=2620870 RepID=UPI00352FA53A
MKKIWILMTMSISLLSFAQEEEETPPPAFYDSEVTYKQKVEALDDPGAGGDINGEDPIPIDDYIPLLLITGIGLSAYIVVKKKKIFMNG